MSILTIRELNTKIASIAHGNRALLDGTTGPVRLFPANDVRPSAIPCMSY